MAEPLDLGCFSVRLGVADLDRSPAFSEALGFREPGGDDRYRIPANAATKIGLLAGMYEGHIRTLDPGRAPPAGPVEGRGTSPWSTPTATGS